MGVLALFYFGNFHCPKLETIQLHLSQHLELRYWVIYRWVLHSCFKKLQWALVRLHSQKNPCCQKASRKITFLQQQLLMPCNCFTALFLTSQLKLLSQLKRSSQLGSGQNYRTLCTARLLQPPLVRALVLHITQESPNAHISITTNTVDNDATADNKKQVTSPIQCSRSKWQQLKQEPLNFAHLCLSSAKSPPQHQREYYLLNH